MTGIFQGFAAADGKIPVTIVTGVPMDAVVRNGFLMSPSGSLYAVNETSQPRVVKFGVAFEESTGLLIIGADADLPYSIPMGGMSVSNKGAVLGTVEDPDVIHQAVGLKIEVNGNIVTGTGLTPAISNQLDASQDQVTKTGDVVESIIGTDGLGYNVPGGSGVTHGTVKSPTNLDVYTFDGTVNSYIELINGFSQIQPFTAFVALRKSATGTLVAFDNK